MDVAQPQLVVSDLPDLAPGQVPLILLHPFPYDARSWQAVREQLPADIPVLAPDAPGFGNSPAGEDFSEIPDLGAYGEAVYQLARSLRARQAVVAGVSMGGYVALALSDLHPDFVAGLALIDTTAAADTPEGKAQRRAQAAAAETEGNAVVAQSWQQALGRSTIASRPEVVEQCQRWLGEVSGQAIAWAQRAMAARPARHGHLTRLACPALVVRGMEDEITSVDAAEAMANSVRIGGGMVKEVSIPEAGHLTLLEAPKTLARVIAEFYRSALTPA